MRVPRQLHPDHLGRQLGPPLRVNARATWLLIKAFAEQLPADPGLDANVRGRIVALTSDHTDPNAP